MGYIYDIVTKYARYSTGKEESSIWFMVFECLVHNGAALVFGSIIRPHISVGAHGRTKPLNT